MLIFSHFGQLDNFELAWKHLSNNLQKQEGHFCEPLGKNRSEEIY